MLWNMVLLLAVQSFKALALGLACLVTLFIAFYGATFIFSLLFDGEHSLLPF